MYMLSLLKDKRSKPGESLKNNSLSKIRKHWIDIEIDIDIDFNHF